MEWFLEYLPTLPRTEKRLKDVKTLKLAYLGINWDKDRFKDLFECLIQTTDFLRLYGRPTGWSDICQTAYQGMIPFDGRSVVKAYRNVVWDYACNAMNSSTKTCQQIGFLKLLPVVCL